jgi:hypothetical protein
LPGELDPEIGADPRRSDLFTVAAIGMKVGISLIALVMAILAAAFTVPERSLRPS